jgi:serine/threonine protein kinase
MPVEGIFFSQFNNNLHLFMYARQTLNHFIHTRDKDLTASDKLRIAKNIATGMDELHMIHSPPAHTHLNSKNIMINPADLSIKIADYGLHSLKKYAASVCKYKNYSAWSAPEMFQR